MYKNHIIPYFVYVVLTLVWLSRASRCVVVVVVKKVDAAFSILPRRSHSATFLVANPQPRGIVFLSLHLGAAEQLVFALQLFSLVVAHSQSPG